MFNLHINLLNGRQNHSYNAAQEWLRYVNQASAEQFTVETKTRVILFSNPSVLDEMGVSAVPPPPPHKSLLTSGSRVFDPVGQFVWTSSGSLLVPVL